MFVGNVKQGFGKVMAEKFRWWAEFLKLTDENQSGLRAGRITADATQVMVRLEEDAEDLRKRRKRRSRDEKESGSDPVTRLLDIKKVYHSVNTPAL